MPPGRAASRGIDPFPGSPRIMGDVQLPQEGRVTSSTGRPRETPGSPPRGEANQEDAMTSVWLSFLGLLLPQAGTYSEVPARAGTVLSRTKIVRGAPGDQFGRSVDVIGDLDDDGVVDLVVGASHDDDGAPNSGSIWILFMNADGTVKLGRKISQTQNGLQGIGLGAENQMGKEVSALGDLDGDGVEDIAVGAPSEQNNAERRVILCFLRTNGTVKSYTEIYRETPGFGRSLANMGDLDGDGVVDLMIGTGFGAAFLYYLNADGTVKSSRVHRLHLGQSPGFDTFYSVGIEPIGDFDGDGIADALVGDTAEELDGVTDSGVMYISLVDSDGGNKGEIPLHSGLPGLDLGLPDYPNFGRDGALLGDLDGNGTPELAVGCSEWHGDGDPTDSGAVFILFMNPDGTTIDHRRISRTSGNLGQNLPPFVEFGISTAPLGDFNGDGTIDLVVGARFDGSGSIFLLMLDDGRPTFTDVAGQPGPVRNSSSEATLGPRTWVERSGLERLALGLPPEATRVQGRLAAHAPGRSKRTELLVSGRPVLGGELRFELRSGRVPSDGADLWIQRTDDRKPAGTAQRHRWRLTAGSLEPVWKVEVPWDPALVGERLRAWAWLPGGGRAAIGDTVQIEIGLP